MGTTTRFAVPYPEATDEPDGAGQMQTMAVALDAVLAKAQPIADAAARPNPATRGWIVHQDDDDGFYGYTGSVWVPLSGAGGGGGGGHSGGRFAATAAQDVPATSSGIGTVVGFPGAGANMLGAATNVTRSASGAGHKFVLGAAGLWSAHATVRLAANSAAGEVSAGIWADLAGGTNYTFNVAHDGGRREGLPRTLTPGAETYLPSGAALVVALFNGTGGTRQTEPSAGAWVHLDLWLKG